MEILTLNGENFILLSKRDVYKTENRIRFLVFLRDQFSCFYCGRNSLEDGAKLNADHLIPQSKAGEFSFYNLVTACEECNAGKDALVLPGSLLDKFREKIKRHSDHFQVETGVSIPSMPDLSTMEGKSLLTDKPDCPDCGEGMVLKYSQQWSDHFWGCSQFPKCKGQQKIQDELRAQLV